ncbi:MAG: TfoX/Sxy family protein [Pseudomonadota bacterium]|jgi:DNA transformation protein|nr:TfoX/Sxy family protein [Pseudomonadota bacterium]
MDAEAIREIFHSLGPIHIRRMFGGKGIYQGEVMFALEAGGELYLKVDEETVAHFRDLGSRPFSFPMRNGQASITSYWLMPETAFDDPDEAAQLSRMAVAAAGRVKAAKVRGSKAAPRRKARKPSSESVT